MKTNLDYEIIKEHTNKGEVFYTRNKQIAYDNNWQEFEYFAICGIENKETHHKNIIYTANVNNFNALLSKWNRVGMLQSEIKWSFVEILCQIGV